MLKRRAINMILPVLILIFGGFLFINNLPIIDKTYGIDVPFLEPDIEEREVINLVEELKKTYKNNEVVGYLEIPNTNFKRVITKGSDNEKYLSRNAYLEKDILGNPFLDYRVDINSSRKLLIYGHNSKDLDAPFKYLENYYDYEFFKSNKLINLTTDKKKVTYEIFSVYVEPKDWSYYTDIDFKNNNEWLNHLKMFKKKSMYETGVDVDESDKILILQTCSHNKDYQKFKNKFLLILAREVE